MWTNETVLHDPIDIICRLQITVAEKKENLRIELVVILFPGLCLTVSSLWLGTTDYYPQKFQDWLSVQTKSFA